VNSPQVILVSGSSSGFGRLTVETLARQGHTVWAGIRHSAGRNSAVAQALHTFAASVTGTIHSVELDVTDDASISSAVERVVATSGRLDVVVNNAGVGGFGPIEAFTIEQAEQLFATNLFGVLRMNRAALPQMRAQGSGLLVQIGSVVGRIAYPFTGVYAASKFALEGLTEAYRLELAALGIDAAIVEPGTYPTNIFASGIAPADADRAAPYQALLARVFAGVEAATSGGGGQAPNPQEVADAIANLIARPTGQRPLRTVVAIAGQREAPLGFNTASDEAIRLLRQAFGLAPLPAFQEAGA
jgi:NAD(P)-dependent dehydrogenase (short-subunit alcohol dehydrogenase family)